MTNPVAGEKEEKENVEMAAASEQEDEPKPGDDDDDEEEQPSLSEKNNNNNNNKKRPADTQDVTVETEEIIELEEQTGEGDDLISSKQKEEATKEQEEKDETTAEEMAVDDSVTTTTTKAEDENNKEAASVTPPIDITKRPVKRARSAYFVFCDEKRAEVKEKYPGQGVAAVARALGQLWNSMSAEDKKPYYETAAAERERVQADLAAWKAAGGVDSIDDNSSSNKADSNALTFPVARIRKICKLDPEVRGLSKESVLLITKAAELATAKLAGECVKTAAIQNRRKLLPDDVASVCSNREQFLFLAADIQDLHKQQKVSAVAAKAAKAKSNTGSSSNSANNAAASANAKPLTDYFSSKAKA